MLKLALKRLTSSDLTYFQWHLDNNPAGKQKAINLSRNVFIDVLYPSLQNMVNYSESNVRIPIDLYIFGPALAGPYHLKRKIIKADSYKNWRLDGETIRSPEGEPERFMVLKPGDIAVMAFEGDLYPRVLHIDFLAADLDVDRDLLKASTP
jgi:hypothetical protein